MARLTVWLVPAVLALGACETEPSETAPEALKPLSGSRAPAGPFRPEDPRSWFDRLEQSLLLAQEVELTFELRATGAFQCELAGDLKLTPNNEVQLTAAGTFSGADQDLRLDSDGEQLKGTSGAATFEIEVPIALSHGMVIGFCRMGLLHNVAVLSGGAPPDHTDGSADEWLTVSHFGFLDKVTENDRPIQPITFDIAVEGQHSAQAILWLDAENGLPVHREQNVFFEGGSMTVHERYEFATLPPQ